jgi:hypothetical protein
MDQVTHWFDAQGNHWLEVNGVHGRKASYHSPAECAGYMAFTQYFGDSKERVIKIEKELDYLPPKEMLTKKEAIEFKDVLDGDETIVDVIPTDF